MAAYDNKVLTGDSLVTLVSKIKAADATKQDTIDSTHKLDADLVATSNDKQFVSASDKTAWNAKAETSDIPTALADLTADSTHRVVTDAEKTAWSGKAETSDIPDELADLSDDATHRLVTDTDKTNWNGKTDLATVQALGYQTASQVTTTIEGYGYQNATQVQSAITTAVAGLTTFHFIKVNTLPVSDIDTNAIYLVPKATASQNNIFEEWAYIQTSSDPVAYVWEHLGDTQLDLETLSSTDINTIWNAASAS